MYQIKLTKQAIKDYKSLSSKLKKKFKDIAKEVLAANPHGGKKLLGDLKGNYSYRLSIKDRIIYSIDKKKKLVYVKRTRTHYGE